MNPMEKALRELGEMDELAARTSPLHRLHPAAKLFVTLVHIVLVLSFGKYELSGLFPMLLVPVLLFQIAGIALHTCFYKLRLVLPLVLAVGLFNPLLDRAPLLTLGSLAVSGGVVSMLTLTLKGVYCLTASFLLVATTPVDSLCAALRRLHVPGLLVTLLLLTWRYAGLLTEELASMTNAYRLRAPGQKGIQVSAWGSFLGQLLLRTMDRGRELYESMLLRGYHEQFPYAPLRRFGAKDAIYTALCTLALCALRLLPVAGWLGERLMR